MPKDTKDKKPKSTEESKLDEEPVPDMGLAQDFFIYSVENCAPHVAPNKAELKTKMLAKIEASSMGPFYRTCVDTLGWEMDKALLEKLDRENEAKLEELKIKHDDAVKESGEVEILDTLIEKAKYYAEIGDKLEAYSACDEILSLQKISSGKKIDMTMLKIRVAMFHLDVNSMKDDLAEAKRLNKIGGDWDRRNRLKVYEALYAMLVRDIPKAAALLLDCVATFTCVELCTYDEFMFYTIVTNCMSLPRTELKKRLVDGPEVVTHIRDKPVQRSLLNSLYDCDYADLLRAILATYDSLTTNRYLARHARFVLREYRVLAYKQFLDAYKSVRLESMAETFRVRVAFIDGELAEYISSGRLHAKIDKVSGVVETCRPDERNAMYQSVIKKGDALLNQIQRLARAVDA